MCCLICDLFMVEIKNTKLFIYVFIKALIVFYFIFNDLCKHCIINYFCVTSFKHLYIYL